MKLFIFYASHLVFPFITIAFLGVLRGKGVVRFLALIGLLSAYVFGYARYGEPRMLHIQHETLFLDGADEQAPNLRLALFSDTHFGIFKHAMPMSRIVDAVKEENPDAVFIAGDFLYHLKPEDIPAALAPLGEIAVPVFAVLGNHDVGFPGPIYTAELYNALQSLDVTLVENRAYEVTIAGQELIIGGVSDLWQRQQSYDFSAGLPDKPLILLTHNPDTAFTAPADVPFSLMLAGHTHGGQVRIPGLVQRVVPTQYPFDKGLHEVVTRGGDRLVYVTTGTGMVGLPLRLNMPPRIDILTVHLPAYE